MEFDQSQLGIIQKYFLAREETLSVAESVTAGWLQAAISDSPEAAKFFQGGITAYNLGQKSKHLNINPIHAFSCNAVSPTVAREMSAGVSKLFCSDWGIGITGYASAVPESGGQLYAFYAITYKQNLVMSDKLEARGNKPADVQLGYVKTILKAFSDYLSGLQIP